MMRCIFFTGLIVLFSCQGKTDEQIKLDAQKQINEIISNNKGISDSLKMFVDEETEKMINE